MGLFDSLAKGLTGGNSSSNYSRGGYYHEDNSSGQIAQSVRWQCRWCGSTRNRNANNGMPDLMGCYKNPSAKTHDWVRMN